MKKVGIVGYGHLGKYLVQKIQNDPAFDLVFVWNRSTIDDQNLDKRLILENLNDFENYEVDLIVEVAHPIITQQFGPRFLSKAHYAIGSPTALADQSTLDALVQAAKLYQRNVYVPCGAFWGASDIRKMANKKTLKGLRVTMKKHPDSLKLEGSLKEKLESSLPLDKELVLYEGPVRGICSLAPNNVNTMAVGALAASNLGFDQTQACLVADPLLTDKHLIEIDVTGPYNDKLGQHFKCTTIRSNPAILGHVTGNQTYESFYSSLLEVANESASGSVLIC